MIDFLGIGAQKCGTTWAYEHLRAHPQIRFPANKEIHFWDLNIARGVDWWLAPFRDGPPGVKQGEITPAYAFLDIEIIKAIHGTVPNARLFYMIRNPLARAWSSAQMALRKAELTMDEASDQWFIDHFRSRGSRSRGDYLACLDNWLRVFPAERLQLIVFDDIRDAPGSVLARLARHIGVDPSPYESSDDDHLRIAVNTSPDTDVRPTLLPKLRELYADQIERLEARLQRDLGAWLEWDGRR
jgi:hypothetical protein